MGLFINSHLQSLSIHKRLTELEKLSEISTGILALKAMVEGGEALDNHQIALENLMRMMPMLSSTQQKFVMEEILTPLMIKNHDPITNETEFVTESEDEQFNQERGALSDYEMEFQLKLNRQGHLDIKELNREQRNFRHKQEIERARAEEEVEREKRLAERKTNIYQKIEETWGKIDQQAPPQKLKQQLMRFLYSFATNMGHDHPLLVEARNTLKSLKRTVK